MENNQVTKREMSRNRCIRCSNYIGIDSWCEKCDPKQLKEGWTSGNEKYDAIIRETQEHAARHGYPCLKWIPFESLANLVKVRDGDFGTIYVADWVDGRGGVHWKETIKVAIRVMNCTVGLHFIQELNKGIEIFQAIDDSVYQALGLFGITRFNHCVYALVAGTFCNNCGGLLDRLAWCKECKFEQFTPRLSSGNVKYDRIIDISQCTVDKPDYPCLKWIPPQNLKNLVEIKSGNFGTVYTADWIEGEYDKWTIGLDRQIIHKWRTIQVEIGVLNLRFEFNPVPVIFEFWCNKKKFFRANDTDARFLHELFKGFSNVLNYREHHENDEYGWRFCEDGAALFGISQLDGRYVLVAASLCNNCGGVLNSNSWCTDCGNKQLMMGWTSENSEIDEIIKNTQRAADRYDYPCLKWIPPDQIQNYQKIGVGGFGIVYSADWLDCGKTTKVAIKVNHSYENFLSELKAIEKFKIKDGSYETGRFIIGVSKKSDTNQFVIVMGYAVNGDLRNYLKNNPDINWSFRLSLLFDIISSLRNIHSAGLIHRDLHGGNVIIGSVLHHSAAITDYGRAVGKEQFKTPHEIIGAADIYSFGIIMAQMSTGQFPFSNRKYSMSLIRDIRNGLRPHFAEGTPQFYIDYAELCMHADPKQRPTAVEAFERILSWVFWDRNESANSSIIITSFTAHLHNVKVDEEVIKQFKEADKKRSNSKPVQESTIIKDATRYYSSKYSVQKLLDRFDEVKLDSSVSDLVLAESLSESDKYQE
ncbi:hypothetical protein RclHR1_06460004 [Rhizophagus clarus]|uniref:Protein kinase domain-containing protein n=1 Tax=Rhizophagus clarus TaxID=94130 RepID=A0A2Z6RY36_9GLOM|nr:hypothetical protein RclHR1_06460004 [Rhizophagus clarus]